MGRLDRSSLRESCPYSEFSGPYSVRMRENTDQKNSEFGHFSRKDGLVSMTSSVPPHL